MSTRRFSSLKFAAIVSLLFVAGLLIATGCSEDSPVADKPGNGGQEEPPNPPSPPDSVELTFRLASWDDLTGPCPVQDVPAGVDEILFEISAPDMQPQTRTVTPGQPVVEEVFTVTSGAFDYSFPSYTTAARETSFLVTKLEPNTTHYFVVRAVDRAGNTDLNTSPSSSNRE